MNLPYPANLQISELPFLESVGTDLIVESRPDDHAIPIEANQTLETTQTPRTLGPIYAGMSNEEFMSTIFVALHATERPYVVGIPGTEIRKKPSFTNDQGWVSGSNAARRDMNWYFTFSTYLPVGGKYFRRKANFYRSYGIMFDDVGTKAETRSRLDKCPPSYLLETSEGNFQAGYLFRDPVSDLAAIESLLKAVVQANLCDPGAGGPAARLGRMPSSINGKYDPIFNCKLVEWHPDRRYSIDEIYDGLNLTESVPLAAHSDTHVAKPKAVKEVGNANEVYSPKAAENPVITACKSNGTYKQELAPGKHDITCPWVKEHTAEIDSGTVYFEPTEQHKYGAFKCFHGHCSKRKFGDFLEHIGVSLFAAKHGAVITILPGEFDKVIDAAEAELVHLGNFYQRSGVISNVLTDPGSNLTAIKQVNVTDLTRALSKKVTWVCNTSNGLKTVDPSSRHVNALYSSGSYRQLPVLVGVARQPYLRDDGSLMSVSGYDAQTKMFGVFDEQGFFVPEHPTKVQAQTCLAEIDGLLSEFGFAAPHDRSAALGLILTSAIRASLPLAPMGHIKAPQISSGKSFLCDLIGAFSGPGIVAASTFPDNDEECSKLLLSAFSESPSVIKFDNLTSDLLPFKSLCSAITEQHLTGRILGVSQMRTVSTRCLLLSSGNNVDAIKDMTRRVLTVNLDPGVEMPATRKFQKNPLAMVLENRGYYVSLALTIVRAYIAAGLPLQAGLQKLSSFDHWTRLVRSPLVWLEQPDPATTMFTTIVNDPDREQLGELLAAWYKKYGSKPTSISDIAKLVENGAFCPATIELAEVAKEIAEQKGVINRKSLGRWILRHQGQIVGGLKFARGSKCAGSARWVVKPIEKASAINPATDDQLGYLNDIEQIEEFPYGMTEAEYYKSEAQARKEYDAIADAIDLHVLNYSVSGY